MGKRLRRLRTAAVALGSLAPSPKRMTGRFASAIFLAALMITSAGAAPNRGIEQSGGGVASVAAPWTSLGKAIKAAPARGLMAARKALATASPAASGDSTVTLYFVTGLMIATESIVWW